MQLDAIEAVLCQSADACIKNGNTNNPWNDIALQRLRQRRLGCKDKQERSYLSKQIFKRTRQILRKWKTQRIIDKLTTLETLRDLGHIHAYPIKRKSFAAPDLSKSRYSSKTYMLQTIKHTIVWIRLGNAIFRNSAYLNYKLL